MKNLSLNLFIGMTLLAGCGRSSFDPGMLIISDKLDDSIPSAAMSQMVVSTKNVADGMTPAEITLTIRNSKGNPLAGVQMNLSATGATNVIVPCTASDTQGISRCKLYSTTAQVKIVQASGINLLLTQNVDFEEMRPYRNLMGVVTSGGVDITPSGAIIASASGIVESHTVLADSGGTRRAQTSVQSVIEE